MTDIPENIQSIEHLYVAIDSSLATCEAHGYVSITTDACQTVVGVLTSFAVTFSIDSTKPAGCSGSGTNAYRCLCLFVWLSVCRRNV